MNRFSNEKRTQKDRLYQLFAEVANALANPHRLELLDLLVQAPRTVEELAQETSMSVANTSQHLQRLKKGRLVEDERNGTFMRYRLADPAVARLWLELRGVGERQLAEVERSLNAYRNHRGEYSQITPEELQTLQNLNRAILLDVRPRQEYQAGHLPGAISIPVEELDHRLDELPKEKTIVAYCRGPYCVYADQALELLSSHGWAVARLEEGVAEWERLGYSLEH